MRIILHTTIIRHGNNKLLVLAVNKYFEDEEDCFSGLCLGMFQSLSLYLIFYL